MCEAMTKLYLWGYHCICIGLTRIWKLKGGSIEFILHHARSIQATMTYQYYLYSFTCAVKDGIKTQSFVAETCAKLHMK